jgi:hypothetical protein
MKTNSSHPSEDLQAIRDIMERSSKFLSLSGLSGIFAGLCALTGAAVAWFFILNPGQTEMSASGVRLFLMLDALLVLISAFLGAVYFSYRKAGKSGQSLWNHATRRVLIHLLIPLASGGIFILILASWNNLQLASSAMLIFYGLSLVNAGKFTFGEIHYLGLTEIALGILAGFFSGLGLLFWTIGFGLMHIIYGSVVYFRHERQG